MIIDLNPPPPYNFNLKLKFYLLPSRPTPSIVKDNAWLRAFNIDGKLIPVKVWSEGSVEKPKLKILTVDLSKDEKRKVVKLVSLMLGVGKVRELYSFMDKDEILKKVKNRLYGFGKAGLMASTIFEGIVKAIIQQQISLKVAETITANLVEKFGEKIRFQNENFYDFPSAQTLAEAKIEELRKCGLSWRKAGYIKNFSLKVFEGKFNPENLRKLKPNQIVEKISKIKGAGRWTAELVMVASMGLNVIPADDLGVRKTISYFYFNGELQDAKTIKRFAEEKFGKFLRDILVYLLFAYRSEKG
ncbi:MAG: hypothetical protein B6U77_03820 [Candidatus Hecatellales archaeon ex4484_218]|nr:MAG: hypothetical protein B6U77_03820 [Candidatus Hecatellales archaeon ex4484_218]